MSAFFRIVWIVVRKDITVEVRSLELLSTTVFFAITVVLMFAFGLVVEGRPVHDVAPAILWIAIAFSGTLALGRTFERERQNDTLRALLLAPADRPAIYVGKLVGILLLLDAGRDRAGAARRACSSRRRSSRSRCASRSLLAAGTLGFAAVGTLFAAMLVRARSRDVLLPIMLYPMTVPVMIAGVRGTAALLQPTPDLAIAQFWLGLLGALRRRVRDARAVDLRAGDDGLTMTRSTLGDARPGGGNVRRGALDHRRGAVRGDDGPRLQDLLLPHAVGVDVPGGGDRRPAWPACASCSSRSRPRTAGPLAAAELAVLFGALHARDRAALGAQGVGRVVGVGPAADLEPGPVPDLRRVSAAAPLRRAGIRQARRRAWRSSRCSTSCSSTSR